MQSSADLDQALGLDPNYIAYGQATEAAGAAAIGSIPPVAVISGVHTMATAENAGEFAFGATEAALGLLPMAFAARAEVAAMRASGPARPMTLVEGKRGFTEAKFNDVDAEVGLGQIEHSTNLATTPGSSLLPGEGQVATYRVLQAAGVKGDNITPHHIPSARHMANHGVSRADGISINMEQPSPGSGGRHRRTFTYGTQADVAMAPRDALAAGVRDARTIYREDGLYDPYVRQQLQQVIRQNKVAHPEVFRKPE